MSGIITNGSVFFDSIRAITYKTVMRISVMDYSDYRIYLQDQLNILKLRNGRFSVGAWSQRLGLKSSSGLLMVLNGQRNPGPALTAKLCKDLRLSGREATFFRDLILLEKAKSDPSLEASMMERLAESHPQKKFKTIDSKVYKAISQWHFHAIRELVDTFDFKEDPQWIQKRLANHVSLKDISDALQILEDHQLLKRDEKGKLVYNHPINSTMDIPDSGLKQFHTQVLELAQKSLGNVPVQQREISGLTFTLKTKDLPRAKEIVRQFLFEMSTLGQGGGDEVYVVETALLPLTKLKQEPS